MPARKPKPLPNTPFLPPDATPEVRENHLISLAFDLVEQRLRDGTASPSETVHFLRMGSVKEREELEKLRRENELLKAKTKSLEVNRTSEQLYRDAIAAMRSYSPTGDDEEDDEDGFPGSYVY